MTSAWSRFFLKFLSSVTHSAYVSTVDSMELQDMGQSALHIVQIYKSCKNIPLPKVNIRWFLDTNLELIAMHVAVSTLSLEWATKIYEQRVAACDAKNLFFL